MYKLKYIHSILIVCMHLCLFVYLFIYDVLGWALLANQVTWDGYNGYMAMAWTNWENWEIKVRWQLNEFEFEFEDDSGNNNNNAQLLWQRFNIFK